MAQDDTVKQSHVVVSSQHDLETKDVGHGQDEEVFAQDSDGVNFRTVTWPTATVVFLKIQFAMSILSVPYAVATLGAIGGALSIVGWAALNTYTALILGELRNRHPSCHMLPDMLGLVWGKIGKELVGTQILIAQILISAAGMVSLSTAFNALSNHSACTVIMTLAAAILITFFSSVRTFSRLGWLTWFGFATFFIGVFIFVVAVTQQDRPAAAPQDGPYELGYVNVAYPTFVAGITATANLFIFNSGSTMYLPVISEMRRPQDYRKACILAGALVGVMYLTFSLVIYRWTGVWLSSPAFNSAGPVFKKISWAFAVPGLMIGVGIYQHVAAKYVFVRALRGSRHLEANTVTHWSVWLGTNVLLGSLAFIIAVAVPILNYLLGLAASLCFAPFSLIFPCILWTYDFGQHRSGSTQQKVLYGMHIVIILLGLFLVVGGTYGVAVSIKEAFDDGKIPGVFSCADNSL